MTVMRNTLFFKPLVLSYDQFCGACVACVDCKRPHSTKGNLYGARVIAIVRGHMTVDFIVRCYEHIAAGSWVGGEIKIDVPAPPTADEIAALPVLDMQEFEQRASMPVKQAPPWRRKKV